MNVELSQVILNNGVTFLAVATGIIVIVVGWFLVKLLMDLSVLTKNLNETSILMNTELKPTLKELNETMHSINSLVQSTNDGVGNVRVGFENALTKTKAFSESLLGGFLKGFMTVYSLFIKKR